MRQPQKVRDHFPDEEPDVDEIPGYLSAAMYHQTSNLCSYCGQQGHSKLVCPIREAVHPWAGGDIKVKDAFEQERKKRQHRTTDARAHRKYRAKQKAC